MHPSSAIIVSLSLALCLSPAHAAKHLNTGPAIPIPQTDIQSPQLTAATGEAMEALGKMFDARDALKDCHVEYRSVTDRFDDSGHPYPYTVTATGDLQKPNKMSLRLTHGAEYLGQIVSDGVTSTYYNAKTKSYIQFPARATYDIEHSLGEAARKKLTESDTEVKTGKSPDAGDDSSESTPQEQAEADASSVFGPLTIPATSCVDAAGFLLRKSTEGESELVFLILGDVKHTKSTLAGLGHSAEMVDLSRKTTTKSILAGKKETSWSVAKMHFAFDGVSKLPLEWSLGLTVAMYAGTPPTSLLTYDYKFDKIVPAAAPLPASTFTWAIPAGAKLYIKPKEVDPFANTKK